MNKKQKAIVAPKASKTTTPKPAPEPKTTTPRIAHKPEFVPLVRRDGENSRSITAGASLQHYVLHTDVRTKSGRPTLDVADKVADLLRGKDTPEVIRLTASTLTKLTGETIKPTDLETKYGHLNAGQIRMNCGNRLRAAFKADAAS